MSALAFLSNNTNQNVTLQSSWRSSNTSVATVSGTGMVRGVGPGGVSITATYQGVSSSLGLTIPVPPPPPQPQQFTVSGRVSDGTSGTSIGGAEIRVVSGVNAGRSTTSDSSGRYSLGQISVGTMTMRADARDPSDYQILERTVTVSGSSTVDFALPRVVAAPGPPAPAPGPAPAPPGPGLGSGALVEVVTDSKTCGCSRGTIHITANGAQLGTTTCLPGRRVFSIAPGNYTFRACDDLGCWREHNDSVSTGEVLELTLTCTTTSGVQSSPRSGSVRWIHPQRR
jgi:hypothetical protein